MRRIVTSLAVLAVFAGASLSQAEELKSGPQPGESVGAFEVEKCAGNENDGVAKGDQLCYRCKLGNRPVVTVFAHTADESLAKLVKELDGVVASHEDEKFAAFVNLLGDNPAALKENATKVIEKSGAKNVAVVVPGDHKDGPSNYNLNPKADVTVLVYKGGTVKANFAFPRGGLKDDSIREIKRSAVELLN